MVKKDPENPKIRQPSAWHYPPAMDLLSSQTDDDQEYKEPRKSNKRRNLRKVQNIHHQIS